MNWSTSNVRHHYRFIESPREKEQMYCVIYVRLYCGKYHSPDIGLLGVTVPSRRTNHMNTTRVDITTERRRRRRRRRCECVDMVHNHQGSTSIILVSCYRVRKIPTFPVIETTKPLKPCSYEETVRVTGKKRIFSLAIYTVPYTYKGSQTEPDQLV